MMTEAREGEAEPPTAPLLTFRASFPAEVLRGHFLRDRDEPRRQRGQR
jgi:hypothetical protein